MLNKLLIGVVALGIIAAVLYIFRKRTEVEETDALSYRLEDLDKFADVLIQDAISVDYLGSDDDDYNRKEEQRKELRKALKTCGLGDRPSKLYVKNILRSKINSVYNFTDSTANMVIPFNNPSKLTPKEKFDILLYTYTYTKNNGVKGYTALVEQYDLLQLRQLDYAEDIWGYSLSEKDIENIYAMEEPELDLDAKIDIIIQRVYEGFKGRGVVDELLDQNIDGVNGGTSGLPSEVANMIDLESYDLNRKRIPRSYEAVWLFYKGVSVHLQCLSFGSELELRRICQNIYTYDNPGQFNQEKGHIINELADQSRVVVVGPKFADSWAFFVRKFDGSIVDPSQLFNRHKGSNLVVQWGRWTMLGELITIFTGDQGTGKTTTMRGFVKYIPHPYKIRVQEGGSFELWLRVAYPHKNLLGFRETSLMSPSMGLVVQKKTDGTVNLVGEIADDESFSVFLKAAKVASRYSLASHHAQTLVDLINAGRDALMITGQFRDERKAEEYMANTLQQNFHHTAVRGVRFIERVTLVTPLHEMFSLDPSLREATTGDQALINISKMMYDTALFDRRPLYTWSDIIAFEKGRYVAKDRPSDRILQHMVKRMDVMHHAEFCEFINETWGYVIPEEWLKEAEDYEQDEVA